MHGLQQFVVMRRPFVIAVLTAALEVRDVHGGDADAALLFGVVAVRVVEVLTCNTHTEASRHDVISRSVTPS